MTLRGTDRELAIAELARAGLSIRAISAATGHSPTTVQKYLAGWTNDGQNVIVTMKQGLDGKRRPSRRYDTAERDHEIRLLHFSGKTIAEIAAEVGCSVGTAHRVLNRRRP